MSWKRLSQQVLWCTLVVLLVGSAAGPGRRFAVCNAAEGEPGTFKDRALLRHDPYRVLEGLAIASFAVGAEAAYIATKARYDREAERLSTALAEIEAAGLFADLPITLVLGPDEYLFGEEKAMLEVIEGKPPLPRWFAPHEHGLFAVAPQLGWEATPRAAAPSGDSGRRSSAARTRPGRTRRR